MAQLKTDHKRLLRRTVKNIARFLNEQRYHPRSNVMLDRVVLALVSKAVKVAQGVISLIDAELPEEAFGLSRTLVEIALSLRFITNRHSERRARRFVHYVGKWKIQMMRRLEGQTTIDAVGLAQPKYTKAQLREMMPDYEVMLKWAREYPKSPAAHWSQARYGKNRKKGKASNARTLALEADGHEKVNGTRVNWQFDYEWVYSWTSQYVHATAACIDAHITEPLEAFRVQIAPHRSSVGDSAVFNAALYLYKILRMAFPAIGQPFPPKLSEPLETLLQQLAEAK
jgi:Family of unknown function (DUF5677)